ncbi:MAG TPA: PPOX class F420-dependent oxidoreductase [bacterium]|nr:PPOX class F420-dependent oxidoreductase [bacterium]
MTPELQQTKYINLITFRRDGREVSTPVWAVAVEGKLYCYTNGNVGKVKRIRATGRVRVAPSDLRGKPVGPWVEGQGRIVQDAGLRERVLQALGRKYGLTYYLLTLLAVLGRRTRDRIVIELDV